MPYLAIKENDNIKSKSINSMKNSKRLEAANKNLHAREKPRPWIIDSRYSNNMKKDTRNLQNLRIIIEDLCHFLLNVLHPSIVRELYPLI